MGVSGQMAPAAPLEGPRCIVLLGGGGTVTHSEDVDSKWFVINSGISKKLIEALVAKGYRIEETIVDVRDADRRFGVLVKHLQDARCDRAIQLAHILRISTEGQHATITAFDFQVSVVRPVLNSNEGGTPPKTGQVKSDYSKDYEYPLTSEIMQNLSFSELAQTMAADLEKSGALGAAPTPAAAADSQHP
jgi:hypothetical protein